MGTLIRGAVNRQDYLAEALKWISDKHGMSVGQYMSEHRHDGDISELEGYFNSVIDWINAVFDTVYDEMRGLEWGRLYEKYHNHPYDPHKVGDTVNRLYYDDYVKNQKGIFEYVLGGCMDKKLLEIRVFDDAVKKYVYGLQTENAKEKGISNCPLCALGHDAKRTKIWAIKDMDADHVAAWSKGGATNVDNCQMLCKTHNRAKGNR